MNDTSSGIESVEILAYEIPVLTGTDSILIIPNYYIHDVPNIAGDLYSYTDTSIIISEYDSICIIAKSLTGAIERYCAAADTEKIEERTMKIPSIVLKVFPNPFNSTVEIPYYIPYDAKVSMAIYDIMGHQIAQLVDDSKEAGNHTTEWNGENTSSGIYFVRLKVGDQTIVKRAILMK